MTPLALDTSIGVPLLLTAHPDHRDVSRWWHGREVALCGHALHETYSVLTRLPEPFRLTSADAARLLEERFAAPLLLRPATARRATRLLADAGVAGGATYDGLVGLAALDNGAKLTTRDARARQTYERMGADVVVVG